MFNNKRNASHGNGRVMSALPPKADMCGASSDVGYVPKADIATLFDDLISGGEQTCWDGDAK